MKRRDFLHSAAALGVLAAVPLAAHAAHESTPARQFVLARSASFEAGAGFTALGTGLPARTSPAALRIRIGGLHRATGIPVLHELALNAMFANGAAGTTPFHAWRYVHAAVPHTSQALSFVAAHDSLRDFELEYRLADDELCRREACVLTQSGLSMLSPGHYVLLGPRRNGMRVNTAALRHSGDAAAPLGDAVRDFDYLALRIEAIG